MVGVFVDVVMVWLGIVCQWIVYGCGLCGVCFVSYTYDKVKAKEWFPAMSHSKFIECISLFLTRR